MNMTLRGLFGAAALTCGALLAAAPAWAGVVIDPIFSGDCATCFFPPSEQVSLSTVPGAEAAIEAADQQIASQFGASNLTTNIVYIGVHDGTNGFLGASSSGQTVYSYTQYVTALTADALAHPYNQILNSAVANLGSGNGANTPLIALNTTDARNLGLGLGVPTAFGPRDQTPEFDANGNYVGPDSGGVADGVVYLNVDQPLSYTRPIQPFSAVGVEYDAETTMEHETDEVLGIGGAGSQLNNANDDPNYASDFFGVNALLEGPMDLYRYSSPGVGSFDFTDAVAPGCTLLGLPPGACTDGPSPYFSVDGGKTAIDTFNQMFPAIGGDAGDWGLNFSALCPGGAGIGGTGDVQDAFSCNNHQADVAPGTPSFDALEAIGYDPVPEPAAWAMVLLGVLGVGTLLRTARRPHGALSAA